MSLFTIFTSRILPNSPISEVFKQSYGLLKLRLNIWPTSGSNMGPYIKDVCKEGGWLKRRRIEGGWVNLVLQISPKCGQGRRGIENPENFAIVLYVHRVSDSLSNLKSKFEHKEEVLGTINYFVFDGNMISFCARQLKVIFNPLLDQEKSSK